MLIKGTREDAIQALINTWLKDTRKKCGWCGAMYNPLSFPCCEKPFIADNFTIMSQFYEELKIDKQNRKNEFASSKNMRWKLSFPPSLLSFLENSFRTLYQEELFNKKYSTTWFAKKFRKCFAVPERI
jgi:hypothetical protein